uniref:KID domain-containing protein n=1 Tax=Setaria digitata TaxID=48799 RepID=A0A915PK35_9BILA
MWHDKDALRGVEGTRVMSREPSILHNPSTSEPEALKVLAKVILQNQSNDEIISDDEARRRREQLNRRPSYRPSVQNIIGYYENDMFND